MFEYAIKELNRAIGHNKFYMEERLFRREGKETKVIKEYKNNITELQSAIKVLEKEGEGK